MIAVFLLVVLLFNAFYSSKKKKTYINICMFVMFIGMALRHEYCFMDTLGYVQDYNSLVRIPLERINESFPKDSIFWYFSKIINVLSGNNYTVWLTVLSLMTVLALRSFVIQYSEDPMFSFLVYTALGFLFFSMAGLRQTMALSIGLIGIMFLLQNRWLIFLICCIVASLFHKTAIVLLPIVIYSFIPSNKKWMFIFILLIVLSGIPFMGEELILQFVSLELDERFSAYAIGNTSMNATGLILQLVLSVTSFFCLYKRRNDNKYSLLFTMSIVGIAMQSMSFLIAEMFRASMYYSIANVILFPNAMQSIGRNGKIIKYICLILLVGFCLVSNNVNIGEPYYFFFQNPEIPSSLK